jgi:hypothetical protein
LPAIAAPQSRRLALKSRIMAVVDAESELLLAAARKADAPRPAARRERLPGSGWCPPARVRGALACALLGIGVAGGLVLSGSTPPRPGRCRPGRRARRMHACR